MAATKKYEMKVIDRTIYKNDVPVAKVTGWAKGDWGISTMPKNGDWTGKFLFRVDMIRWIKANPELF